MKISTSLSNISYINWLGLNKLKFFGGILIVDSEKYVKAADLEISFWEANKFLRTKYGWYIVVEPVNNDKVLKFGWIINKYSNSTFDTPTRNKLPLDSYEAANDEAISNILEYINNGNR